MNYVWVFSAEGGRFPGGVFGDEERAVDWVRKHRLTGVLTRYPVNTGVYEWAIESGVFSPKGHQETSKFIGRFTSAALEHRHFDDGQE